MVAAELMKKNEKLWDNYQRFARSRGELVLHILSGYMRIEGAAILDFGCGSGGVSLELAAAGAHVTAFDIDTTKSVLLRDAIKAGNYDIKIVHDIEKHGAGYDAVILLDVIEHVIEPKQIIWRLERLLKPRGYLYISTPNKFSFLNVLQDPHFSLPLVSLMQRKFVAFLLANILRWQSKERIDYPQLLSLKQLDSILKNADFSWHFVNTTVLRYALQHSTAVWNRASHLHFVKMIKKTRTEAAIEKIVSDKVGLYNKLFNPTWYIVAQKSQEKSLTFNLKMNNII
jgi:2-polyprenyl-3-methyl-5-hydroxy-6-metoxy-1,4-benzoquinol methylase